MTDEQISVRVGIGDARLSSRISISPGVVVEQPGDGYDMGSIGPKYVPVDDWRALTDEECDRYCLTPSKGTWKKDATVQILPVAKEFMSAMEATGIRRTNLESECSEISWRPDFFSHLAGALSHLGKFCSSPDRLTCLGICVGSRNMKSSTRDTSARGEPFIGMHVDRWDNLPLLDRHRSRNRLCVNIGQERRYFIFLSVGLREMLATEGSVEPFGNTRATLLAKKYVAARPNTPVLRVCLEPGEAYIAPTESIMHDGSTVGSDSPDLTVNMLGHFFPGETWATSGTGVA